MWKTKKERKKRRFEIKTSPSAHSIFLRHHVWTFLINIFIADSSILPFIVVYFLFSFLSSASHEGTRHEPKLLVVSTDHWNLCIFDALRYTRSEISIPHERTSTEYISDSYSKQRPKKCFLSLNRYPKWLIVEYQRKAKRAYFYVQVKHFESASRLTSCVRYS